MKLKVWIIRIVLIILILGWMYVIFGFSADDGDKSQSLSDKITFRVMKIIKPDYKKLPKKEQHEFFMTVSKTVRKIGHFGEYGILGTLVTGLLLTFERIRNVSRKWYIYLMTVGWCLLYAISDEIHQGFVKGRNARPIDIVVDVLGGFVAAVIMVAIWKAINKRKEAKAS
ncbi:MAG: VanZ family protein [Eubacterium sp.]|nr:VanZ family protein [Eubacterium sp.]